MNLINELSSLESELESLRSECKISRESKIISDFENDQLRRRNVLLEEKCERLIVSNSRLKTLLDRTGADLVAAIQRYNIEANDSIGVVEEPRLIERAAE